MRLTYFLAVIFYALLHFVQGGNQHRSVLLADVSTLTLHKGQRTQARRVSSIPQVKCVGGTAKCAYEPDVVQCYNRGSDGVDIQWECTAQMPQKYKFGRLSVSCEGYSYPEDPYILAGSCGLEYNLDLTDKNFQDSQYSANVRHSSESRFIPFLIKVAIIVGIFFFLKSFLSGSTQRGGATPMSTGPDHRPPGGGGGPGWFSNFFNGGNGGGDARRRNPPPPGFRTDFTDDASCHTTQQQTATGAGTGNFLTGAALGALGGYFFGNRNRGRDTTYNYPTGTANTGWFGGGGDTTTRHRPSPSPSSSSSTYTSSGFGGTTRR